MPDSQQKQHRFWEFIDKFGRLQTLWPIALAFIAASRRLSLMPSGWHEPQYYLTPAAWFFGTWATAATLTTVGQKASRWNKRRRNPHHLTLTTASGDRRCVLTLKHHGEEAIWSVDARVTKTEDVPNPSSEWYQCHIYKGGRGLWNQPMANEEWATIVLGHLQINDLPTGGRSSWLRAIETVFLDGRWAEIELIIKSAPPMKSGVMKRTYKVTWDKRLIEAELISSD